MAPVLLILFLDFRTNHGQEIKVPDLSKMKLEIAEEKLNEAINASIQKGVFSEEERESFVEELRKRRSGGWKFSNTMFRCPCKPDSNSPKNIENLKAGKYKYIASPISGFFLNNLKEERMIHPPSTESGDLHDIEDYTASYIICGDLTSLSSFCRDTSDQNSLYGILRSKIRSALNNPDQNAKGDVSNFIDTLLHLGVDFNDILPFIDKIYADEFKTAISSNHKMIFNDIIKMAEKKDMSAKSHDKNSGITRSDILGDLKLVCSNGHRFKIIDSIRFGQTHTGHSLPVNFRKLWISNPLSDIFKRTGIENLRKSLKTSIPGNHFGHTILTKVDPSTLRGMKPFSEWDGIWDPKKGLSEYYYQDFDGYCYIFESRENSVIWGDYNRKYSVMPYLERDNKTKLLFSANLLKTSDEVSGDEDGGEASLLSDQVQAERYKEAVEDSMGGEALIDTTAHERAKLDIYYSPLVVILQSALASIKDFCDRSTSIELNFPMHGKPVSLKNESEIAAIAKEIIKDFYLKQAEYSGEDEESTEDQLTRVVNDAFAYFDQNYLQDLRTQDLRLLNMLPPSTSPIEKANISRMIIRSVNYSIEDRAYELTDIHSRIFDSELKERIESELFSDLGDKIQKIVTLIKSNIEPPKTNARTGLIEGKEILMVSKLQGSEYIGRVLMMSSALYLAESVSRLYRKYLDKKSTRYIGVDIGIDLSSPEKIIKTNPDSTGSVFLLEEGSYNNISTSFPVDQLLEEQELLLDGDFSEFIDGLEEADKGSLQDIEKYQEDIIGEIESLTKKITNKQNELKNLKDSNSKDTKRINKLIKDIESHLSSLDTIKEIRENFIKIVDLYLESRGQLFLQFFDEIKDEMARVQTACTNYKYTERAVEIIKESLLKKIEVNKDMDETSRKITKTIIDRCITNSPITTISLSAGGKYHAYYSGENASSGGGPFRVLPLFNADQVIIPGLPAYAPPIYALSSSNNSFSNLGLQLSFQPIRNKHIVLYKDIDGDFIAPYPTSLPDDVVLSGWKTGLVDSTKFSIKNVKEISLYYHPFTLAVLADGTRGKPSLGDNVIGFVNSHLKYNSVAGFNFGPLSTRSGTVSLYPPLYDHGGSLGSGGSHIGLFLPLKYSKSQEKLKQTTGRVAPFFDAKIPIEIPTEQPGKTIKINISDFLLRDPPELAQQILTQISKRYVEYQNDSSNTGNKDEKLRLREECKRDIRELFDTYRNLPYGVTNTASSSHVRYEGKMGGEDPLLTSSVVASATPYIPMADFITCNRILNLEEFSPEFGGHNFWTGEDRDSAPAIKGAIEQMIIDLNSLDDLADIMNQQLNDNEIKITARDLMDPHHGVFDKIYQKVKKDIMLSRRDASEDDIRKKARELIEKITTYEVGDNYVPLSSVEGKTRKGVSYSYRADTFWTATKPNKRPLTETPKKFGRWIQSTGRFYPISESLNPTDNQPGARIKVMSEIFPFNREDGTGRAETLRRIQNPDSSTIISHDDLNYAAFLYGQTHTMDSAYYSGKTPEEAENFRKQLKKSEGSDSMIISAVKYAAGISEFFSTNIVMGLKQRIQIEKERREIDFDRRETQYYGRAISKKASVVKTGTLRIRVAPPASVDNLRMAGMISLLSMFTK
jgi:hypothetical protein